MTHEAVTWNPEGAYQAIMEAQRKLETSLGIKDHIKNGITRTSFGDNRVANRPGSAFRMPIPIYAEFLEIQAQIALERCLGFGGEEALIAYHAGSTAVSQQVESSISV